MYTKFLVYGILFLLHIWGGHCVSLGNPFISTVSHFCGQANPATTYVSGGQNSVPGTWPWVAALVNNPGGGFFCAGNLISKEHVVTAAHCIHNKYAAVGKQPHQISVWLGKYNLRRDEEGSRRFGVYDITIHPDWNSEVTEADADIAVLRLAGVVEFTVNIKPICLPEFEEVNFEETGITVGWGLTDKSFSNSDISEMLNQIEIATVTNEKCYKSNSDLVDLSSDRTFCAGKPDENIGSCAGDSGGGIFVSKDSTYILRGIVSAALINQDFVCSAKDYVIHTNVAMYIDWITEITEETAEEQFTTLECKFGGGQSKSGYKCTAVNWDILSSKTNLQSVYGPHEAGKSDLDVENLSIQKMVNMRYLPSKIGQIFPNLKVLEVKQSGLRSIKKEKLENMRNLKRLILHSKIQTVTGDVFDGLTNLEELVLEHNQIKTFQQNVFRPLNKLIHLNIGSNRINFLPENVFADLTNLKTLRMSANKIKQFPPKLLYSLVNLEGFWGYTNVFEKLGDNLFRNNLKLETIGLGWNRIKVVGDNDFSQLKNLYRVDLRGNECIDKEYGSKTKTVEIDFDELQSDLKDNCFQLNSESANVNVTVRQQIDVYRRNQQMIQKVGSHNVVESHTARVPYDSAPNTNNAQNTQFSSRIQITNTDFVFPDQIWRWQR